MKNERELDEFVNREVYYNVSHIVAEMINLTGVEWWHIQSQVIEETEDYAHEREVFEYYIVSDYLADELQERGEVIEHDFYGLTIWGRTTTGQAISMDWVIQDIYNNLMEEYHGKD